VRSETLPFLQFLHLRYAALPYGVLSFIRFFAVRALVPFRVSTQNGILGFRRFTSLLFCIPFSPCTPFFPLSRSNFVFTAHTLVLSQAGRMAATLDAALLVRPCIALHRPCRGKRGRRVKHPFALPRCVSLYAGSAGSRLPRRSPPIFRAAGFHRPQPAPLTLRFLILRKIPCRQFSFCKLKYLLK
jgi:hypothetical protein